MKKILKKIKRLSAGIFFISFIVISSLCIVNAKIHAFEQVSLQDIKLMYL